MTPRLAAVLLAPTLLLHAQQPGASTLHGSVLNSVTHQPIARALVALDQYSLSTLTDNEGRFTFDGLPTGPITLSIRRPGFTADSGDTTDRESVSIPSPSDLTFELIPFSAITGQLVLPGDDPPDLLQLQLLHQQFEDGRAHWAIYRNVEAASDGRFRFGNLPPGAYLVHVGASPDPVPAQPPSGTVHLRSGYVPTFYPAAREIAAAGILTLAPGQQSDIRMELIREPFYPVSIPVESQNDPQRVIFQVTSDSFLGYPARFSPQDAMVHTDLPSGHYLLDGAGYGPNQTIRGRRAFDVNAAPTRTAAITLAPAARIPVTIHAQFSLPAQQAATDQRPIPQTAANLVNLTLQPEGSSQSPQSQRPNLQDDPHAPSSGVSYLVGADPGKYWVSARAFNGYVADMTSGSTNLLENPLTISADGSASPIDISLRDDLAQLTVTLAPAFASSLQAPGLNHHSSVYFQAIPLSGTAAFFSLPIPASTFSIVTFTLTLTPGRYIMLATAANRQFEYRAPTVLADLSSKGKVLTLEPGTSASITIDNLIDPPTAPAGDPQ